MDDVDYILGRDAKGEDMAWPPERIDLGDGRVIMIREWRSCAIFDDALKVMAEQIKSTTPRPPPPPPPRPRPGPLNVDDWKDKPPPQKPIRKPIRIIKEGQPPPKKSNP